MLELDEDIESDLHRFHGVWVDLDQDQFAGLSSERLFSLILRLPAYDGALAARVYHMQEEAKKHNPSHSVAQPGAVQNDNVHTLLADPAVAQYFEYEQV